MRNSLTIIFILLFKQGLFSQDIQIYHGAKSESVFLKKKDKVEDASREKIKIIRSVNGTVSISIVNPNPFFYNYEIKTEDIDIVGEYSDQFSELVKLITSIPDIATSLPKSKTSRGVVLPPIGTYATYKEALLSIDNDIKEAKKYIDTSDNPESKVEGFNKSINSNGYGFRAASLNIKKLSSDKYHLNSKTLEKDINDLLETTIKDGSFSASLGVAGNTELEALFKHAFQSLNADLVSKVKKIIEVTQKDDVIRFQVPVKANKQTNVRLIITKISETALVKRELLNEEIATVLPFYARKMFEVVPVVNLILQPNSQIFSVDNGLVKSTPDDDAKFNIGAMALVNFTSFGEFKEFGVGIGIGYSMQPSGKASSIFAIPSLSYRDTFRIGFGFGYSLSAVGLTNGAKVDAPLPSTISNIEDVIDYKRRLAGVITLTIAGIKF